MINGIKKRNGITKMLKVGAGVVLSFTLTAVADVAERPERPRIVIPKLSSAPTIDGQMRDDEWGDAAIITGMGLHRARGRLDYRQAKMWVGYDEERLYMAVKSPVYPSGRRLVALRQRRDGGFYGDDVIEILLDPNDGQHPGATPFFYFIGNSAGVICQDSREMPGIGQSEMSWNGNWQFANHVDDDWWTAELSIPLKDLEVEDMAKHPTWRMQFSRTYARPVNWVNWPSIGVINSPAGAAQALMREGLPFLRLESVAALTSGLTSGDISGEVVNPSAQPAELSLMIGILDGDNTLASWRQPITLAAGQRTPFSFDKLIDMPEKASCEIFLRDEANDETLVYHRFDFVRDIPLPEIQEEGEEPDFAYRMRHILSAKELVVGADIFGHPRMAEIKGANIIIKADDDTQVKSAELDLSPGGSIDQRLDVSQLPEGRYKTMLTLVNADGERVDSGDHSFIIRHYDWLGAGIGETDEVLPPWTPLQVTGNSVECWGRVYTFNGLAFPERVTVKGENVLSGPVTLVGVADGKPFTISSDSAPRFTAKAPASVTMEGAGKGGGLEVRTVSTMEYDGMVKVELEIVPQGRVRLDSLRLVIPYPQENATLIHAVGDHMRTGQFSGALPDGDGAVWNSRDDLFHRSILGTFTPYIWLGNEKMGFAWAASSDEGWVTDDRMALHEITRETGETQLVCNFVARAVVLDSPRRIVFALQASPVKPLPEGWRGWEFTPQGGDRRPGTRRLAWNPQRSYFYDDSTAYVFGAYVDDYAKARKFYQSYAERQDLDVTFFTTTVNILNSGTPEADAFRDEWFHGRRGTFNDHLYRPRRFGDERHRYYSSSLALCPSSVDFRLWAIRELLRHGVVNGIYEDNAYLRPLRDEVLGIGYERDDGEWQADMQLFEQREYRKRMAGIFHELGMESQIFTHITTSLILPMHSFSTIGMDGEWREVRHGTPDFMDQWPNDYFRAVIMPHNSGIVPLFMPMIQIERTGGTREKSIKHARTALAVLQLHDVLCEQTLNEGERVKMLTARSNFGIADRDVEFVGYWDSGNRFSIQDDDAKVSYWEKGNGETLAVLVNFAREPRAFTCRVAAPKVSRVYDAVTNEEIAFTRDGDDIVFQTTVPHRDYQLVRIDVTK